MGTVNFGKTVDILYSPTPPKRLLKLLEEHTESLYAVTFAEGDTWGIKAIPLSPDKVIEQLQSRENKASFGVSSIHYKTIAGADAVMVFNSIMLPDGRIWDTRTKGFRFEK